MSCLRRNATNQKLIVKEGRDANVETTNRLEALIDAVENIDTLDFKDSVNRGLVSYIKNPFNDFLDDIMNVIDMDAIRARGPRILFTPSIWFQIAPVVLR